MLPDGWKRSIIEEHIDLLTGYAFKSKEYTSREHDIRLLRGDNVAQGYLRWRDCKFWPQEKSHGIEKYYLQSGDIVIAMDRTWIPAGVKVSQVKPEDLPCLLVQRVARLRAKNSLSQEFLKQIFFSHQFSEYVKKVQTETAVPHISPSDIRELSILLPTLPEQQKIAEILCTWDQAIETVEALIANSQAQKKALMQQLLTGKRRLPGFSGEWQQHCLGKLCSTYGGLTGKTKDDFGSGKPYVPYKNVFQNRTVDPGTLENVQIRTNESQNTVQYGDVLFTTSSETPDEVGMASVVLFQCEELYLNSFCFGLRFNGQDLIDPSFASHLFRSEVMRKQLCALAQGSTRYNLSKRELLKLELSIPTLNEQLAITEILNNTDDVIRYLTAKLNIFHQEKAALMQQLLTGKRRVNVSAEATTHKEVVNA